MSDSVAAPGVIVVGSINMDLVLRCAWLPKPGETIAADAFHQVSGGKGANQAVSAANAGGAVSMIGRVGDDVFGERLLSSLQLQRVDCSFVRRTHQCESGLAFITVDEHGQNTIVIQAGANAKLSTDDILSLQHVIESSDVVLLQLEIPLETVLAVIRIARAADVRVILDPAPAPSSFPDEILQVDFICPNEREAEQLTGRPVHTLDQVENAARVLHGRGARHVVITLGEQGAYLYDDRGGRIIPAFETNVIDTTAAGDAFTGALAVRWAECHDLDEAVRWGNAAGAIAASRPGAQPSLGSRSEIETLLRSLP